MKYRMMEIIKIILLCLPLVLVLLSLAVMPLITKVPWNKYEKVFLFLMAILSTVISILFLSNTNELIYRSIVQEYIPFITTLFVLYLLSHGINIEIKTKPSPIQNAAFLLCCSFFASFIGTTGAAMLFLKPFLKMNEKREKKEHLLVFFIFIVCNIGGLLTPLGDPPLLLGYLHGVGFFWCLENVFLEWCVYIFGCLLILFIIDMSKFKKEDKSKFEKIDFSIKISGGKNIILLSFTILVLFVNFGEKAHICDRDVPTIFFKIFILLLFCCFSLFNAKKNIDFSAFKEVSTTFLVIFIVISPVIFILESNADSIQKVIHNLEKFVQLPTIYFWLCGIASSFLDNAPSYLLFFEMAGGNANELMYSIPEVLKAISISSVVMGSMTYIGNAPNMMVKSISMKNGIKMPSFIMYMFWSCCVILPLNFIVSMLK